ncbi:uncharacterized protein [Anabrus simplex]|uniref:uncharacterized protein n=1 Tax=Anabrus simplex TaxID=316456 RepID=UPI0034DDC622
METKGTEKSNHPKRKQRNQSEWKREKRKRSIIAGESHISVKGEFISRKEIGSDCKCKLKCYEKVDAITRQMLFDGFYSLKSYDEQNAYLFGLIRKHDVKRKKNLQSDRRTCTYKYYVRSQGKEIQVCKLAFAHIHAVSFRKIRTLSEKLDQNILFPRDGRGKHDNRPKRISQETVDLIKNHIFHIIKSEDLKKFMKEDKNRQMIAELNVAKLYVNFLQSYEREALNSLTGQLIPGYAPKVKSWLYRKVFHEEVKSKDFQVLRKRLDAFSDDDSQKTLPGSNDAVSELKEKVDKGVKKSRRKGTAKRITFINSGTSEDNSSLRNTEAVLCQQRQGSLVCHPNVHNFPVNSYSSHSAPQNIESQSHRNISVKHHQQVLGHTQTLLQPVNHQEIHPEPPVHHSLQDFSNSHHNFLSVRVKEHPVNRMTLVPHSVNYQTVGALSRHAGSVFSGGANDEITIQRVRNSAHQTLAPVFVCDDDEITIERVIDSAHGQHYGTVAEIMHSAIDPLGQQMNLSVVSDLHAFYS